MSNSIPIPRESSPELVLLLQEPLIVDAAFLRSAYQAVLELKLDSDTEFVIGEFPFFMLQTAGVLVSVTISDLRYGDPHYGEAFPHYDLAAVQRSLGFLDRRRIAKHEGWIGACLLREEPPSGLDPYVHVGRALCPFALPEAAVGVIAPGLGRAALFAEDHQQLLRTGDVRHLFSL